MRQCVFVPASVEPTLHTFFHLNHIIMFDFQQLHVYTKARSFTSELLTIAKTIELEHHTSNNLIGSAFDLLIAIAKGTAPYDVKEKSQCFYDARGTVHACAAILDYALVTEQIDKAVYDKLIEPLDGLTRMLAVLARKTLEFGSRNGIKLEQEQAVDA